MLPASGSRLGSSDRNFRLIDRFKEPRRGIEGSGRCEELEDGPNLSLDDLLGLEGKDREGDIYGFSPLKP